MTNTTRGLNFVRTRIDDLLVALRTVDELRFRRPSDRQVTPNPDIFEIGRTRLMFLCHEIAREVIKP